MKEVLAEDFSSIDPQLRATIFDTFADQGLTGEELKAAYLHQLRIALGNPAADAFIANRKAGEAARPLPPTEVEVPTTSLPQAPCTTIDKEQTGF